MNRRKGEKPILHKLQAKLLGLNRTLNPKCIKFGGSHCLRVLKSVREPGVDNNEH